MVIIIPLVVMGGTGLIIGKMNLASQLLVLPSKRLFFLLQLVHFAKQFSLLSLKFQICSFVLLALGPCLGNHFHLVVDQILKPFRLVAVGVVQLFAHRPVVDEEAGMLGVHLFRDQLFVATGIVAVEAPIWVKLSAAVADNFAATGGKELQVLLATGVDRSLETNIAVHKGWVHLWKQSAFGGRRNQMGLQSDQQHRSKPLS